MSRQTPENIQVSASSKIWKDMLAGKMPRDWEGEINAFESELLLKKQNKIDDKVFAESRLRRGAYGQRYDNGQRHDGRQSRPIPFPRELTKGPNTVWDAPGMERIKIPYGGMTPDQMDVLADLAEEYSDGILHVTTRQDIQLHYVHIEDTPPMFRRLAARGITTREACGNSVRNVTACPLAGVCHEETFDVTGYADAIFRYLLGHPDVQDFGRKFKIAFSGCKNNPCGLTGIHDLGLIAKVKDGKRGFEYYVGGGLGAVPYQAKLFDEFVTEEEMLPLTQAVCRIFARHGEKKNRNRARIKFLVNDWGIEKFRDEVLKERKTLKPDPRWTEFLNSLDKFEEAPLKPTRNKPISITDADFTRWLTQNARSQRQEGYSVVHISLPLGDITSNQMRDLADVARKYTKGSLRTTVEQNIILRWIRKEDLHPIYQDLKKIDLAEPVAGTVVDITACPGTDTCKLGISASRGLAGELRRHLATRSAQMDEAIKGLCIKISGCFNSCAQQHIADIGFYGISRKANGYVVPHFQLVLGGELAHNAGAYGLPIGGIPSKAVPATVDRLGEMYLKGKEPKESFKDFVHRLGKVEIKKSLEDLMAVPAYQENPGYYTDWGDVREFTTSDIGRGECAGEVVSLTDMGLKEADRLVFESQVKLDGGDPKDADGLAYQGMLAAAQALIKSEDPDIPHDPHVIVEQFKIRFCDNEKFYDPFAGAKFAKYLFDTHQDTRKSRTQEQSMQLIQEAQLFVDAAHACNIRMSMEKQQ